MSTRQILVNVWQGKCINVTDFLSLIDRFDFEVVVEILRDLTLPNVNERITVNEAEEKLEESLLFRRERRKKCNI